MKEAGIVETSAQESSVSVPAEGVRYQNVNADYGLQGYHPIIPQSLSVESAYVAGLLSALLLVGIRYPDAFARDNGGSSTPAAIQRHCSNGDSPPSNFDPSDGGNRLALCHGSGAVRRMSFFGGAILQRKAGQNGNLRGDTLITKYL
ncbi:hypothetical protein H105_03581 [Trichophyton soudanense CBS 452.61]|uniref:Uncharacterized protein n=1 Tax=Trichophyton soudanense CBS 452.61 TaxID=1215331 RepID=A0A022XWM4_TRISD|nr:hypothetical protein H105_03581 [Trichophyton soudanense CBS 452.61]